MVAEIRNTLKAAGLYRAGSAGRLGYVGATRIRQHRNGNVVAVVPCAGVRDSKARDDVLVALRAAGFDARESTSGPNTSDEFTVMVFIC